MVDTARDTARPRTTGTKAHGATKPASERTAPETSSTVLTPSARTAGDLALDTAERGVHLARRTVAGSYHKGEDFADALRVVCFRAQTPKWNSRFEPAHLLVASADPGVVRPNDLLVLRHRATIDSPRERGVWLRRISSGFILTMIGIVIGVAAALLLMGSVGIAVKLLEGLVT